MTDVAYLEAYIAISQVKANIVAASVLEGVTAIAV
jgi:hypothetical protein